MHQTGVDQLPVEPPGFCAVLAGIEHTLAAQHDALLLLKKAQKLWVLYRDANCGWHDSGEGTIRRLQAGECMRSMTADRTLELEDETN